MDSLEKQMRRPTTRLLERLPHSWWFAIFWVAALTTMAVGAARAA
jgi:hypothetical protein